MKVFKELEQGTAEWFEARQGIITASSMSDVLAKGQGKTRNTYMNKLIGEVITGNTAPSYSNAYMDAGHEFEIEARDIYSAAFAECLQVGFYRNFDDIGGVGYSPDGVVGEDGLVEIKSRLAHLQVELILADRVPPEHQAQIQCGLWVSEREWLDFVSYCPNMPLFVKRVFRNEDYIAEMKTEVIKFYEEMAEKIKRIK